MFGSALVNPVLPVSDMPRARSFYTDTLGMEPTAEGETWAIYRTAGYWFSLTVSAAAGTNRATAIEFLVSDLDVTMTEMRGRGIEFEEYDFGDWSTVNGVAESPEGRSAWFTDTEGNIIGLTQLAPEMVAGIRQMVGFADGG